MRKALITFALALAGLGITAAPAAAGTTSVYYETVADGDTQFIPACVPSPDNPACDPRGAGSKLISTSSLAYTRAGPPSAPCTPNAPRRGRWEPTTTGSAWTP